jgi:hypothetical protein
MWYLVWSIPSSFGTRCSRPCASGYSPVFNEQVLVLMMLDVQANM